MIRIWISLSLSYFARMDYAQPNYLALVYFTYKAQIPHSILLWEVYIDGDLRRLRRRSCFKKFHPHNSRHPCFFFQVSFPSTVYIHLPATLELGIIYTLLYTDILISSTFLLSIQRSPQRINHFVTLHSSSLSTIKFCSYLCFYLFNYRYQLHPFHTCSTEL